MKPLFPELSWAAWLLVLPVILYLLRRRPRRVAVTTLPFFQELSKELQEQSWWRKMKRWASLALTLLLFLGTLF
ncbi:MAG: BatA domain-containing protein, partial [Verrucomicrobiota bacterium]